MYGMKYRMLQFRRVECGIVGCWVNTRLFRQASEQYENIQEENTSPEGSKISRQTEREPLSKRGSAYHRQSSPTIAHKRLVRNTLRGRTSTSEEARRDWAISQRRGHTHTLHCPTGFKTWRPQQSIWQFHSVGSKGQCTCDTTTTVQGIR